MDNKTNQNKIKIYNIYPVKSYDVTSDKSNLYNTNASKPPICWKYIFNNGCCSHNKNFLHKGIIINNTWHPSFEEIQHLKYKRSKL